MSPYEDIINLPHYQSTRRPQMARLERAAQFAPFAALNGYEATIQEAGRLTDPAVELMEGHIEVVDAQLRALQQRLEEEPEVLVTYFRPDPQKAGGAYCTVSGHVRRVMEYEKCLLFRDGTVISFDKIYELTII